MSAVTVPDHRLNFQRAILTGLQSKPIFRGVGNVASREDRLEDARKAVLAAIRQPLGHKAQRKLTRKLARLEAKTARAA